MSGLATHWLLEPGLDFLNHGSFGACPRPVLEVQARLREELERQPLELLARRLPGLLDAARERLAAFVGADPEGMAAVPNATTGVNTVLRSLSLGPGDELLTTNHAYNACRNALDFVAAASGARVVVVEVPFPLASAGEVVGRVLAAVGERTRLALIDHVTSKTGLVWPVEALARELGALGVDTLVDGAHAPGMLPLAVEAIGCAYYTGNCHKWLCSPKGAAFLWVREDRRAAIRPLVVSHGANTRRPGRSRYHDELDWAGTTDPTAFLSVPAAIDFVGSLVDGGWPAVRERNRRLALEARGILCDALDLAPPCPDEMVGSLASLPLPPAMATGTGRDGDDPLQRALLEQHRIEVVVTSWPAPPERLLRISAQLYNDAAQYRRLAAALTSLL